MIGGQRLQQVLARRIAKLIGGTAQATGRRMPSERELTEALNVSRPVIGEAVTRMRVRCGISALRLRNPDAASQAMLRDIGNVTDERLAADGRGRSSQSS